MALTQSGQREMPQLQVLLLRMLPHVSYALLQVCAVLIACGSQVELSTLAHAVRLSYLYCPEQLERSLRAQCTLCCIRVSRAAAGRCRHVMCTSLSDT